MAVNDKTIEVLNDLIQINNDRVRGYEKAADETNSSDADLRTLFTDFANESRGYASELTALVSSLGAEPAEDTTIKGKVYRAWMDVKAVVTGSNRKAILGSCEFGEDAAQTAYKQALESDAELPPEIRQLLVDQQQKLKKGHDRVRNMRDSQTA